MGKKILIVMLALAIFTTSLGFGYNYNFFSTLGNVYVPISNVANTLFGFVEAVFDESVQVNAHVPNNDDQIIYLWRYYFGMTGNLMGQDPDLYGSYVDVMIDDGELNAWEDDCWLLDCSFEDFTYTLKERKLTSELTFKLNSPSLISAIHFTVLPKKKEFVKMTVREYKDLCYRNGMRQYEWKDFIDDF